MGTGGNDQLVITPGENLTGGQISGSDGFGGPIQPGDFYTCADRSAGEPGEGIRCVDD